MAIGALDLRDAGLRDHLVVGVKLRVTGGCRLDQSKDRLNQRVGESASGASVADETERVWLCQNGRGWLDGGYGSRDPLPTYRCRNWLGTGTPPMRSSEHPRRPRGGQRGGSRCWRTMWEV